LRNYARLVKLDPEAVVASQPSLSPAPSVMPDVPPAVGAPFSAAPDFSWLRYAVIGIVLVAPLVLYFALDDGNDPAPLAVAPPLAPLPAGNGEGSAASAGTSEASLPPAEMAATAAPVAAPAPRKAGDHVIQLQFQRESWVEVRDGQGRTLYSQLNSPGSAQTISGPPPLSLIIGNAAGVRMMVNDRPYDLAPHVKVDVARLTLE
jgi:cytoskeleton protein RodZ